VFAFFHTTRVRVARCGGGGGWCVVGCQKKGILLSRLTRLMIQKDFFDAEIVDHRVTLSLY
jgi:hypothetical protein